MQAGGRGFKSLHLHAYKAGCGFLKEPMSNWQLNRSFFLVGVQVSKGLGWMPRLSEGMKGVSSCDKLGGGAKCL